MSVVQPASLPNRMVLETTDSEQTREVLDRVYGTSTRVSAVRGSARVSHVQAGQISVDVADFDVDFTFDTDPFATLLVGEVRNGRGEFTRQGVTDAVGPGDVFMPAFPGTGAHGWCAGAHLRTTRLEWDALFDAARELRGDTGTEPLRFESLTPVTAAAGAAWRRLVDYLCEDFLADDRALRQPLTVGAAARLLASTVLATFPNNVATDRESGDRARDRLDASPATVRRAVAFIESSAASDITVADIAVAAHVTPRALQYAFRRHLATTPMGYLRRVRLDLARQDLLADAEDTTVAGVAARWGFFNAGRFASAYRSVHGENPQATLRRRTV